MTSKYQRGHDEGRLSLRPGYLVYASRSNLLYSRTGENICSLDTTSLPILDQVLTQLDTVKRYYRREPRAKLPSRLSDGVRFPLGR